MGNATTTGGDWQFMTLNSGYIDVSHNFEDSTVSAPESDQNKASRTCTGILPQQLRSAVQRGASG